MKKNILFISLIVLLGLGQYACSSKPGPEAVADKFLTHMGKGEFEKAAEYGTEQTRQMLSFAAAMMQSGFEPMPAHKNLRCEIDGSTAHCTYEIEGEAQEMDLVLQDGKWLVHQKK